MGRKYAIYDQGELYFITFTVVSWVDIFIRDVYKEIFIESLKFCQINKGLDIFAWCMMTSHVHLIIQAKEGFELSSIVRDLKSFTASQIRKKIKEHPQESRKEWLLWIFEAAGNQNKRNQSFQFWQQHNHPITLSTPEMVMQRLEYLHQNPVEAGFVEDATHWTWSSARDYAGLEGGKVPLSYLV